MQNTYRVSLARLLNWVAYNRRPRVITSDWTGQSHYVEIVGPRNDMPLSFGPLMSKQARFEHVGSVLSRCAFSKLNRPAINIDSLNLSVAGVVDPWLTVVDCIEQII